VIRAALRLARPAALLMTAAVVATACVGAAGAANPGSPAAPSAVPPVDRDAVVIRVDWDGGFVPPGVQLGRLPLVMVTADGRVISQGPQIEIYPGPLMPNLQVRTLTPEALERLVALAREKGLLEDAHYELPTIADAATTILSITVEGRTTTVSAYALAEGIEDGGVTLDAEATAGRAALREYIDALTGLPESDFADEGGAYAFTSLRLFASPAVIVDNSELPGEQPAVDWPLGDLGAAGAPVGNGELGFRCQVLAGDELERVLPLLEAANQLSVFRSGGELWSLVPRPLLPGEAGC
jgi:hypothetical protein